MTVLASDDNGEHFSRSLQITNGSSGYSAIVCGIPGQKWDCAVAYNNDGDKGGRKVTLALFASSDVK
jgi:hypothetical protein